MSTQGLIILIVVLFLLFGGGGGYYWRRSPRVERASSRAADASPETEVRDESQSDDDRPDRSGRALRRFPQQRGAASAPVDPAAFHDDMRKLWEDHVTWTRLYIVNALAGLPSKDATAQRLLRNQTDIGNAVGLFYGAAAGEKPHRFAQGPHSHRRRPDRRRQGRRHREERRSVEALVRQRG